MSSAQPIVVGRIVDEKEAPEVRGELVDDSEAVAELQTIFPDWPAATLNAVLAASGWDKDVAKGSILAAGSAEAWKARETRGELPPALPPRTKVVVNGRALTPDQVALLKKHGKLGRVLATHGNWWYDARSGGFGKLNGACVGYVKSGLDFGPLAADCSKGTTGVFVNGRQLNKWDVRQWAVCVGKSLLPGAYVLDANGDLREDDSCGVLLCNAKRKVQTRAAYAAAAGVGLAVVASGVGCAVGAEAAAAAGGGEFTYNGARSLLRADITSSLMEGGAYISGYH